MFSFGRTSAVACVAAIGMCMSAQASDGLVKSVNVASLKAIFDNAKVPATIEKSPGGVQIVQASIGGYWILAVPADCENNDQTGVCGSLAMLSAAWKTTPGLEMLNDYTRTHQRMSAAFTTASGEPILRSVVHVKGGVAASYVEDRMVDFYHEQREFEQALLEASAKKTGFAATGEAINKVVDPSAALSAMPPASEPGRKFAP